MKKAIVLGGGGFIGSHLIKRLKAEGYWVKGVDLKLPQFSACPADVFVRGDLRKDVFVEDVMEDGVDELYQLAADMGGAGYIFSGDNDAAVMHNSCLINLNVVKQAVHKGVGKLFYSSSACIYPKRNQMATDTPVCTEHSAYPAEPDSEYGWEKLFSERLFLSFMRNKNLDLCIGRLHNIYGPEGVFEGGKEKAPAAICRKVAEAKDGGSIAIWGDGLQTRSFLYIDDCLDGIRAIMNADYPEPVNIGSEEMISISDFARMVIDISGKKLSISNVDGPQGVRGRNSDNRLILRKAGWNPRFSLRRGTELTYQWISDQIVNKHRKNWKKLVS